MATKKTAIKEPDAPAAPVADPVPVSAPGPNVPPAVPLLNHLWIRARRDGFRRAGQAWPLDWVKVLASDFTEPQIASLLAEPLLEVRMAEPAVA
ncbi:hypothetical protein AGMMS50256_37840 [Betaproteobacteria bacterium]|nr:hypothetical protein AGMMS50256_37840 [Betaproteobacteria bacterium]